MATYVGVVQLEIRMPWVHSLKEKRAVVRPIVEGLRRRHLMAVARVDGQDAHGWERLAMTTVGTDPDAVRGMLAAAERFVVGSGVDVHWARIDVERWDDAVEM